MMASFDRPMVVLVTGANRGYGKACCLSIAAKLQPQSTLIILGRTQESLDSTSSEVSAVNSVVKVLPYAGFECANLDTASLRSFLTEVTLHEAVNDLLVIHNSGTVGNPSRSCTSIDLNEATQYMAVNFSSMVAANTVFMEVFGRLANKTVVNVSSLCGVLATKSVSLYCSGKAARDMFFKVMALENPSISVLSYAPGPLKTDMFNCIRDTSYDSEVKTMFQGTSPLEPITSSDRMVEIILQKKYKSGDHVDYFDEL